MLILYQELKKKFNLCTKKCFNKKITPKFANLTILFSIAEMIEKVSKH